MCEPLGARSPWLGPRGKRFPPTFYATRLKRASEQFFANLYSVGIAGAVAARPTTYNAWFIAQPENSFLGRGAHLTQAKRALQPPSPPRSTQPSARPASTISSQLGAAQLSKASRSFVRKVLARSPRRGRLRGLGHDVRGLSALRRGGGRCLAGARALAVGRCAVFATTRATVARIRSARAVKACSRGRHGQRDRVVKVMD